MVKLILFTLVLLTGCTDHTKTVAVQDGDFQFSEISPNAQRFVDLKFSVVCYHIGSGTSCVKLENLKFLKD